MEVTREDPESYAVSRHLLIMVLSQQEPRVGRPGVPSFLGPHHAFAIPMVNEQGVRQSVHGEQTAALSWLDHPVGVRAQRDRAEPFPSLPHYEGTSFRR